MLRRDIFSVHDRIIRNQSPEIPKPEIELGVPMPSLKSEPSRKQQAAFVKYVKDALACGYRMPADRPQDEEEGVIVERVTEKVITRRKGRYTVESAEAAGIAELILHPDWTTEEIAALVGCVSETLYRSTFFQTAREDIRKNGVDAMPNGARNTKEGSGDAFHSDDEEVEYRLRKDGHMRKITPRDPDNPAGDWETQVALTRAKRLRGGRN
jgi:hypothetical protein